MGTRRASLQVQMSACLVDIPSSCRRSSCLVPGRIQKQAVVATAVVVAVVVAVAVAVAVTQGWTFFEPLRLLLCSFLLSSGRTSTSANDPGDTNPRLRQVCSDALAVGKPV